MGNILADYDIDDVFKSIRDGLSYQVKLYALPFYAESSMLIPPEGFVRRKRTEDARQKESTLKGMSGLQWNDGPSQPALGLELDSAQRRAFGKQIQRALGRAHHHRGTRKKMEQLAF